MSRASDKSRRVGEGSGVGNSPKKQVIQQSMLSAHTLSYSNIHEWEVLLPVQHSAILLVPYIHRKSSYQDLLSERKSVTLNTKNRNYKME